MDELLDIARVAGYLGVSERTVYNKVRSGDLPAVKVGRLWRVRESALEDWLASGGRGRPCVPRVAVDDPGVPGPYPYESLFEPLPVAAEAPPLPTRAGLERLLAPLVDPLERRLAFVGLLTRAVEGLGWPAPIVVGGHAVEYYTAGDYPTVDIDLAGANEPIAQTLAEWGFEREGRHWFDDALRLLVEVPGFRPDSRALAHVTGVRIGGVTAYVLGPEDLIIDRLCAAKHWRDAESFLWARALVAVTDELDRDYLASRAVEEDVADALADLLSGEEL